MGLGGILDGGGEWDLEMDGGADRAEPGGELRGVARFTASRRLETRGVKASLAAVEEYAYEVTDRSPRGDTQVEREWESSEAWRAELALQGPAVMEAGSRHELPFAFRLPSDALPSFESGVLRLRWRLSVSIDVSGRDPAVEREILVPLSRAGEPEPDTMTDRVEGDTGDSRFAIAIEPRPLMPGAAFRGVIETAEELDTGRTRVEIKLIVSTDYSRGGFDVGIDLPGGVRVESRARRAVHEQRTLWSGRLGPAEASGAARRYAFEGQLPAEPVATVALPHGDARAIVDVVIDRRLRPDRHLTRPVAISGP